MENEKHFTQIPNVLLNALCHFRIPGEPRMLFDTISREQIGYHKSKVKIENKKFVEMTGLKKQNVNRSIKKLICMNLIFIGDDSTYCINEDSSSWKPVIRSDDGHQKRLPSSSKMITPVIQNDDDTRRAKEILKKTKRNPIPPNVNTEFLELSLNFHQQQKEDGLSHSEFKNDLSFKSKIVVKGAKTLEKLEKIDGESVDDIIRVLDFILNDDDGKKGQGWHGWKCNVVSLALLRVNKDGVSKYFKIKNQMPTTDKKETSYGLF